MKVTGPGSRVPTSGPEETKAAEGKEGPAFTEKLGQVGGTAPATTAPPARPASAGGKLTGDIAEALAKKEITPEKAVDQVVGRILDKQLGADAKPGTRASVENALRSALESDPVLSAKVKSLSD